MIEEHNECVICGIKADAASNMNAKGLLVNEKCGHKFCNTCIERQFARKRSFSCPRCKHEVKRGWLSEKSLEALECERDVSIRKMVKNVFNLTEVDFKSLLEYQDYEEEVEDIVFNLVHSIDVEIMRNKIEKHKNENARLIGKCVCMCVYVFVCICVCVCVCVCVCMVVIIMIVMMLILIVHIPLYYHYNTYITLYFILYYTIYRRKEYSQRRTI